jgi:hypothetical protein
LARDCLGKLPACYDNLLTYDSQIGVVSLDGRSGAIHFGMTSLAGFALAAAMRKSFLLWQKLRALPTAQFWRGAYSPLLAGDLPLNG